MCIQAYVYTYIVTYMNTCKLESLIFDIYKVYNKTLMALQSQLKPLKISQLIKQAGAELGQDQLKLRLDFIVIFVYLIW